jgi:hypothetical protein
MTIVRRIPYTRLTSLFREAGGSIGGGKPLKTLTPVGDRFADQQASLAARKQHGPN